MSCNFYVGDLVQLREGYNLDEYGIAKEEVGLVVRTGYAGHPVIRFVYFESQCKPNGFKVIGRLPWHERALLHFGIVPARFKPPIVHSTQVKHMPNLKTVNKKRK